MPRDFSGSAAKYDIDVDESRQTVHARALEFTGHDAKVLELGCAGGHVTVALKARGHVVFGVEIDPESAELARRVADKVVCADLDREVLTDLYADRDFDIVLMGDVLEHLRDPLSVLREAASMLSDGGRAVISLPNVAFADVRLALLDGRWNYRSDGLLDNTHLRFFTRRTIFQLAEDAGLTVTALARHPKRPGTSNIAVDAGPLSETVRHLVLLDPDADTYVFVVTLERATDETKRITTRLCSELDAVERTAAETVSALLAQRDAERAALEASRSELIALKNTKTLRILRTPRRWYARIRRVTRGRSQRR